ncbi:hypothetical protein P7C70_g2281, partial [Phenoliferia sp. Uapishka_3]
MTSCLTKLNFDPHLQTSVPTQLTRTPRPDRRGTREGAEADPVLHHREPVPIRTSQSPPLKTPPLIPSTYHVPAVRPPNIAGRLPTYRTTSAGSSNTSFDDDRRIVELDREPASAESLPGTGATNHARPTLKRTFNDGPGLSIGFDTFNKSYSNPSQAVTSPNNWHLPLTPPDEGLHPLEDLTKYGFFPSSLPDVDLRLLVDSCNIGADPGMFVADARMEASNGKGGRYIVFNVRVTLDLGTAQDWQEAEGGGGISTLGKWNGQAQITEKCRARFFPTTQRFCIGVRTPETVPPLPRLSRWASLAVQYLLPVIPLVHRGTMFEQGEMLSPLSFALAVGGAGYEHGGRHFHEDFCHAKRLFAITHLEDLDFTYEEQLSAFQAFIIYNACSLHLRSPEEEDFSAKAHATLIMAFKAANFPQIVRERGWRVPSAGSEPKATDLYTEWAAWAQNESIKRLIMFTMLLDLSMSNDHDSPALIDITTMDVELPASEPLWNAETPEQWVLQLNADSTQPLSFLPTLDALLTLDFPSPQSPHATTISRLPSLSKSVLSLFTQTLYRMQRSVQEAIASRVIPGRAAIVGLPPCVAWDPPATALRKIDNGLRVLSICGGQDVRTPWFRTVSPIFL